MRASERMTDGVGVWPGRLLLLWATLVSLATCEVFAQVRIVNGVVVNSGDSSGESQAGFSVPTVDDETMEALEDFRRQVDSKAWEKAFQSMAKLAKAKGEEMLEGADGVILPAAEVARRTLTRLPAEGREAYRLFYDAKARRILEEVRATGGTPEDEARAAQEVYEGYFLTSDGDRAADVLGDALFEKGDFFQAERCWRAILEHHSDTELSELKLQVKRATAFYRGGDHDGFLEVLAVTRRKFAGERVRLGGQSVDAVEFLIGLGSVESMVEKEEAPAILRQGYTPELGGAPPEEADPEWRLVFAPKFLSESMSPQSYYRGKSIETFVPPVASDGKRLFGNWFGVGFALDLETGKLVWLTDKFSILKPYFNQMYRADLTRYAVAVGEEEVAMVVIDPKRLNYYREPHRLKVFNAEDGKLLWETSKKTGQNARSYAGMPVIRSNELFTVSHEVSGSKLDLQSMGLKSGKVNWKISLGNAQTTYQNFTGYQLVPSPAMLLRGDRLYVLVNNGALLAVNLNERRVEWAVKFAPPVGTGERNIYYSNQDAPEYEVLHVEPRLLAAGKQLFFKEARGARLYRVDTLERALSWQRPADPDAVLVGLDDEMVYLLSGELLAYEIKTMSLRWASKVPMAAGATTALVGDRSILAYSRRGIYQLSKANGDVERIFRGADLTDLGGALSVVGNRLICVSNRSITAYPLTIKTLARTENR